MTDELDLALVDALRVAPRAPWSLLAGPLGVDPATLSRRWARLTAAGDAWVTCYPSPERLGTGLAALVEVECRAGEVTAAAARLAEEPWAATVQIVTGGTDLLLTVAAYGPEELARCLLERLAAVPGVLRSRTSPVQRMLWEGSRWHDGALDPGQRAAIAARRPADDTARRAPDLAVDLRIAQALGADGRMPVAELAHRTGMPPTTVRRRLGLLLAGGELVLRCDASPEITGHPQSTELWIEAPPGELEAVAAGLIALPQTRMCALTLGDANLTASLVTHHPSEAARAEQDLCRRFPSVRIRSRRLTLRTAKLAGNLLDASGRRTGYVPITPAG
ncbi:AsnC family transcriptional regulator [Streptomyces sp. NPDC051940]|uniref:AsnC family transcriptional regulator n=1 Tax=Streptomyces sp. NPDC051940 TaxID=3155675 RepID=UPI0034380643